MKPQEQFPFLYWGSVFIQILPLTASLFGSIFNVQLKMLVFYFIISFITEIVSNFPGYFHMTMDNLSVQIYTIVEALIIFYIYYKEFRFKNPYPMLMLAIVFLVVAVHEFSRVNYNSITASVEAA